MVQGSPLRIQDASPENYTDRWNRVLTWLGPTWRTRLHLEPNEREIDYKNTPMIVGWSKSQAVSQARRVWLVNHVTFTHGFMVLDGFSEVGRGDYQGLMVQLLTPTGR